MSRTTATDNIAQLFPPVGAPGVSPEDVRIAEAMVFASAEPLEESTIAARLSEGADVAAVMNELRRLYDGRGVNLVRVARRWMFRTASDLAWLLARDREEKRKLSRAALETLAIVAYHQPVTRADIEEIRGVAVSKGGARRSDGGWLGADAWTPKGARSAHHLRHNGRLPGSVRPRYNRGPARARRTQRRGIVRWKITGWL